MPQISGDRDLIVLAALVFVAILLLLESAFLFWQGRHGAGARKMSRRMAALATTDGPAVQLLKDRAFSRLPGVERRLAGMPAMQGLQRWVQQADVGWTVFQLLLASGALALVGLAAATNLPQPSVPALVAAAGVAGALPWLFVSLRRQLRLARIHRQLPDAIDFIVRSLRSGQAFTAALASAGEELQDPIAADFRAVHDEITFGVSLEDALMNMSDRLPITDLRYFVVSVLIQRDSGGNLTEVLGNLSRLIRERYKLMAKIRVLTADGRFSALILVVAPFALGGLMHLANPGFMTPLWTDPIGIAIVKVLLGLMAIGVLILRKIVRIRV